MPSLLRHRRATVAVAALFAGAPPLAAATLGGQIAVVPAVGRTTDLDSWHPSAARPGAAEGSTLAGDAGLTRLLALIATICVVGVSAGAIRAIIAQRATRTVVA